MPVKLQSKCISIPVTFNCYQTAESWSLMGHSCRWPRCLKVWTKLWLFRALYPTLKSSGEDLLCFVFPTEHPEPKEENMWTAVIDKHTQHVDCSHRQNTHTHTLFRTTVCGSSTTLTKTISPLTKQPGVTCITLCYISYQQKAESKWQVICFL